MPFVSNMPDEEQKPDQTTVPQGTVAPTGSGAGSVRLSPGSAVAPVGGGSAGGSGGVGKTPTPAAGGQFGSLQTYLSANQGQAAPLAAKLTPGIDKQYQGLDTANNAAIASINKQVTSAAPASNPDVMAAEAANPVSFTSDPNNIKQFQSLLQSNYSGPTSAEGTTDYANQQNAINQAIATGTNQTSTEAGRENLLSQSEATPTTGVTALNSAILSQDPNALASIENAYKPFGNLLTNLQTGAQSVNQTISKSQADAAATAKAANDAISSQIGALNTGVTGAVTAAQQKAAAQNAKLKADIAAGTPTTEDLQALGMTPEQWTALSAAQKAAATPQNVYSNQGQFGAASGTTNIDLTNFLNQQDPNSVLNASNMATPEDYAKAKAFQSLLQGMNLSAPSTILNPNSADQAGTAPTNLTNYDYGTALNTAKNASADELAGAQAYVDALQSGADEAHAQGLAGVAARQKKQQMIEAMSMIGLPLAIASNLPGIGKPIASGVDSAINTLSHPVQLGKTVGQGIGKAVTTIGNIFCFHPFTRVDMGNGTTRAICNINVGDMTRGGRVLGFTRGVGQDFYWYDGVIVTAKHAVKENGKWVRVENAKRGCKLHGVTEVVCNLVTTEHRIWAEGIEFADEHETDKYEMLNLDESLAELNKNESIR